MSVNASNKGCKITIHWLNDSRTQRIAWLLEELKLDYDIRVYKRLESGQAPKELKQIHPLGKLPVLEIEAPGLDKPLLLAESGTIVEYLADHFGTWLIPKRYPDGKDGDVGAETEAWLRYRYLMHYCEGSFMTILIISLVFSKLREAPIPFFLKWMPSMIASNVEGVYINPEIKKHLTFLEGYLGAAPSGGEFFCSTLSGADIMMYFSLEAAMARGDLNETSYPKLFSYVRGIQAREAYVKAGNRVSEASGEKFRPFSESKL